MSVLSRFFPSQENIIRINSGDELNRFREIDFSKENKNWKIIIDKNTAKNISRQLKLQAAKGQKPDPSTYTSEFRIKGLEPGQSFTLSGIDQSGDRTINSVISETSSCMYRHEGHLHFQLNVGLIKLIEDAVASEDLDDYLDMSTPASGVEIKRKKDDKQPAQMNDVKMNLSPARTPDHPNGEQFADAEVDSNDDNSVDNNDDAPKSDES